MPTRVRSLEQIHARLRSLIISGTYGPGAVLSQVELARMLGVSRTPIREAMRRLQEEGLIVAEQNQRARVASVSAEALDVGFTDGFLMQATGVRVTVPILTEFELNGILASTASLRVAIERGDPATPDGARRRLHAAYVARAGYRLRSAIENRFEACERYRRLHAPLTLEVARDYMEIASACIARDSIGVTRRLARLDVRLARQTLAAIDDAYVPTAVMAALQMLDAGEPR